MRLALVSPYDPFPAGIEDKEAHVGGVERVFAEVARRLRDRGHDVTVVCSTEKGSARETDDGLNVVRVRRAGTLLRAPVAPLAARVPEDADVVHVAATYPFTTPSVLRRTRQRGQSSVLDFHFEPDPVTWAGRAAARLYRRVGPPAYRLADAVMVRSYAYGRSAPSLSVVPEERWRIIPNGIDPDRFRAHGPAIGHGHLLFVGRLVPYKGLEHLLRALSRLASPPPLFIVGEGPLRAPLQAQAKRLGVDARFLGRVADDELPALYRGARLTLLPSVGQQECFGISLLESMACGTPVLASDIPGVGDVARQGGLTAPSGDATGLARQLARALANDLPHGEELAQKIHATYSWDAVARSMEAVYQEVAG